MPKDAIGDDEQTNATPSHLPDTEVERKLSVGPDTAKPQTSSTSGGIETKRDSQETPYNVVPQPSEPALPPPWRELKVAVIDDAMHPPRLDRLTQEDQAAVVRILAENAEVIGDLTKLGCDPSATSDAKLLALSQSPELLPSYAILGSASKDLTRHFEEFQTLGRLIKILKNEVEDVELCDPYAPIPNLTSRNLILLDYYLKGPSSNGDLAIEIAKTIRGQTGRLKDQQIVLMSSLETVRTLRGEFRSAADLSGSSFAFVGKPDLNEAWKVKAHLGMLERARPYAPALTEYREQLEEALIKSREGLLTLVDDLDIGDYAFLQSRALMNDGHPLGDYVFWLLSSQLMASTFESDQMRERQWALDKLEFVGEPFASTEPSQIVATLLHSALVSRNIGPLGPHPRAKPASEFDKFPLVQLGDVFLDKDRTRAVVVMSADCDLAFSPTSERAPEAETPVMLVPGTPIKLREAKEDVNAKTDGLLHRDEVYRIVWSFAKYRSVELGQLQAWLQSHGYDVSNRDRLRPLFGLKLQQEFGAHLMRVGEPVMPPMTTGARGKVFLCTTQKDEVVQFDATELMITRVKKITSLRITPRIASTLKGYCEDLLSHLKEAREKEHENKKQAEWTKKIESLVSSLQSDKFWIDLLGDFELNAPGSVKTRGPLGFVLGKDWPDKKNMIVLEILEDSKAEGDIAMAEAIDPDTNAVSSAA